MKFFHAASAWPSPACAARRIFFELSLSRGNVEQRAARKRGRDGKGVADQPRARRLRLEAADLSAAADETVVRANLMVADLAGTPAIAEQQLAARDDASADPRAERKQHEVLASALPVPNVYSPSVAQRASLATKTGMTELLAERLAQRRVLPAEVGAVEDRAGGGVDVAGRADADPDDVAGSP